MIHHSKSQVVDAGRVIAAKLDWTPDTQERLLTAYRIAHDWRLAHTDPMTVVRRELSKRAKLLQGHAITAARLKRMQSIRKKLQRTPRTLYQIQDIAGCRAITGSIQDLDELLTYYKSGKCPHSIQREDDYILGPKSGGYRSHHLVLKFNGTDNYTQYNRQTVEIQLRTKLQHAWATAVEAVGLVRDEDLKAARGDARWLRFFAIMASEFAIEENKPVVPGVPENRKERVEELRQLDFELDAVRNLESYNHAISSISGISGVQGMKFLIRYDNFAKTVTVRHHSKYSTLEQEYFDTEMAANGTAVLVDVDRVDDLREAYPNYFLDVIMFVDRVKRVLTQPKRLKALSQAHPPTPQASETKEPKYDLSWWFNKR